MNDKLAAAWQHFFEGQLNKAEELEQQLEKDSFSRWNLRAYLAVERQDYQNAFANLELYLIQAQNDSDIENEHIAYHQLGYVARAAGDFYQALEWIEKEAAFLAMYFPDDHYRQSVNLYELGYLNLKLGRLTQAQEFMRKANIYAKESDDVINHACSYRGLGEIAQALGNLQEARINFAAAIRLFDQAGDAIGKAEAEGLLAGCP